jgi:hypothetical protein
MATTAVLRHRRDTAANWTSNNPVMQAGQLGYETDTRKFKFGDGSTSWISLSYASAVSISSFASASHVHSTGDITTGIFAPSFLGSGSPSSTNFLRGDGSWALPVGGGGGVALAAGTQTATSGTINFANSNGITFGMSGSTQVTASYTVPTQSVQTQASGNIVGSGFTSTTTAGTAIVGTQNSAGLNLGVPAYLTTQSVQTQASGNIARTGFTSTTTTGTAIVGTLNTDGLNLGVPAYLTAAVGGGGVAIGASTQTATSGTVNFVNSNGITFGMSGSTQITASHNGITIQTVQTQASGNIAGAGFSSTTTTGVNIVGTNNSLGLSLGVPAYLTTQSVQTQASGNIARTGFTSTSTTGTALVGTLNTSGLSLGIPAYLTTQSVQTQASGNIVGSGFSSTTTTGTAIVGTNNSNGLSLGVPAYLTTQSVQTQASGNIAGSGFTGANASGTLNSNGLSLSIAAPGAANYSIGVSTLGNTAGSTGITGTRIVFAGINNISLSQSTDANGATISINQTGGGGGGLTNINVSAGTTSNNLSNIVFSNGNGVTFGLNGSTVTASVAAGGGVIESGYSPHGDYPLVVGQIGQGTLALDPDIFPNLTMNMVAVPINFSAATNSTGSFTISNWIGLYSRNGSSLSLAHSTSNSQGITFSGTASSASYNGWRNFTFNWSTSVSGGRYWIGQIVRTTTGGANCSFSQYLASQVNTNFLGAFGVATNASAQLTLGQGFYSTSTTALPGSIAFTQIQGTNSLAQRFPMLAFGFNTV